MNNLSKPDGLGRGKRKSVACLLAALSLAPAALLAGTNVVSRPVGFVRVLVPAGAEALVSTPFNPFNPDINAIFSNQLTGATNVDLADAIRQWDAAAQAYTNAYKAAGTGDPSRDGRWFADFSGWTTSTLSFHPGAGFWIANRQGATQSVFFVGEVVIEDQGAVTFAPGLSLFGYPFSSRMALNDTTLRSDGAGGAPAMTNADNVSDLVGGEYVHAWLLDDTNSPNHGKWVDAWTNLSETILLPGRGYWYQRAPTNGFEWREGRPYGNPFPTNDDPPTVTALLLNSGKDEVTLAIFAAGAPGEKLDVYYKDVPETNVFTGVDWLMAALNLSPGGTTMSWTDAGSPSRGKVNTVYARYYLAGRADIDSDGDGVPDCREAFVYGSNPGSNDLAVLIPFIFVEDFETNTVQTGDLNGQNDWTASPAGTCIVHTNTVRQGWQALKMDAGTNWLAAVGHEFDPGNENVAWVDFSAKVMPSAPPDELGSAGAAFFFDGHGRLVVYDGLRAGTNKWVALTNRAPVDAWARVTVRMDYGLQKWTVYLNGRLGAAGLGFAAANTGGFKAFRVTSQEALLDAITITSNRLAGVSMEGDSLPDDWEMAWFGDLGAQEAADPDGDGLSNLEEWLAGTSPVSADTDGDGMPDGWELLSGPDPLAADASGDPDGDGLSNMEEYIAGTSPFSGDTDNDAIPDKWELDHGLNPLVNDAALDPDEDGLTNLQEYHLLTNPLNVDTDNDGLSDMDEVSVRHTDPLNADTDGDGLPDGLEVICGLNPLVAGGDAGGDLDGDGLSNLTEYQLGTSLSESDTDGDGVGDGEEVLQACTDPLVAAFDGTSEPVITINGAGGTPVMGRWTAFGNAIAALSGRGAVEYHFTNAAPGTYRLLVEGTQGNALSARSAFKLITYCDGEYMGRNSLIAPFGVTANAAFYTPWLETGNHTLRVEWDNVYTPNILRVNRLVFENMGGDDVNTNGLPDWFDQRLARTCSLRTTNVASHVSPVFLEGDAPFLSGVSIVSSATAGPVTPEPLGEGRWYAYAPLSSTGATSLAVSFERGILSVTQTVEWLPLNVLHGGSIVLRKGQSLMLEAVPSGATSGVAVINIGNATSYWTQAGESAAHLFPSGGLYAVSGVYTGDCGVVSNTLAVTVLSGDFPTNEPICWWGISRDWYCPQLPPQAVVESNETVVTTSTVLSQGRWIRVTLMEGDGPHYLIARVSTNGPVLCTRHIAATWLRSAVSGKFTLRETLPDGTQVTEDVIHTPGGIPENGRIRLTIFASGGVFDDGTVLKWVERSELDEVGSYKYQMFLAPGHGVACHNIAMFDGDRCVGLK